LCWRGYSTCTSRSSSSLFKMATSFKFAGCQLLVGENKEENLRNASAAIDQAAKEGANVVSLPECFNSPYATSSFPVYAEPVGGPSTQMLSEAAKRNKVYLIGGSIPEKGPNGELYNSCFIYGPEGNHLGTHRKVHLFDIDIPGKIRFKESETLSPGNTLTIIDTVYGKFGIGICYDIRFPELALLYAKHGCKFLIYPGAFNMTTGPLHWDLLLRARAVDNQVYTAAVSPARNPKSSYQAWGHSSVASPWGDVVVTTEHNQDTIYATIDLNKVKR
jgi:omega-amidase